jgi:hypothetical protein
VYAGVFLRVAGLGLTLGIASGNRRAALVCGGYRLALVGAVTLSEGLLEGAFVEFLANVGRERLVPAQRLPDVEGRLCGAALALRP